MKPLATLIVFLVASVWLCTGQESTAVIGCITQMPNGTVQLQARPSGSVFQLQSTPAVLRHLNELVRAHVVPNGNKNVAEQIELLNQSCASALPAQKPVLVVGKVGEGEMAVPITTSRSADETTPGFQMETILAQEPPNSGSASPTKGSNSLYGPRNIAQAAQSMALADIYAESATRTEIVPGNTLGIDKMPHYSAAAESRIKSKTAQRK